MNGVGVPGTAGLDATMDDVADEPEGFDLPLEPPDPLDEISDSTLLQVMQMAYERSKSAREKRKRLNNRNWDAFHGKFDFLAKKKAGQSAIVIPSLETSLEQVCSQLAQQLVGFSNWFTAKYEGETPPLPGLSPEQAAKVLRQELDRLAVDSGCMPTTYGIGRLIHDSLKIGCIESEICWKVLMEPEDSPIYEVGQTGELEVQTRSSMRLRIDLVPFDSHFPDPSAMHHYNIHEVEVSVADLPDLGFSEEEIAKMRHASPGTEKLEEQRRRSGLSDALPSPQHTVLLREYWGDLIHPQTGELLERQVLFVTAGGTSVVRRPVRIRDLLWPGLRPFINIPLLPTPSSEQHHAFLDIAVPLIEAECELFNLLVDAGFHAALGVKEIHSYKLKDPMTVQGGIVAGMNLERAEGHGDAPAIVRAETGTLSNDMLTVYDRIARTRQEAMRTNDLQLGRQAARKTSATEIREIDESSDDLFSNMALRLEDTGIEPLLELCWLYIWQFADEPMVQRIGHAIGPENAATVALLSPQERFVAFANAASFKVQGYKYQLSKVRDIQKVMMLRQHAAQNPALQQLIATKISPLKEYKMLYQSLGIDPTDLEPDAGEPQLDPMLLAQQSGGQNPGMMPGQPQEGMPPPNMTGERGGQMP